MATPNDMPTTNPLAPTNVDDMNASETAKGLYVDPTPIYQPSLDFIESQRTQANERYSRNKADMANIFGNLTQVNKESSLRVAQQFEKSIADQQMATAQRIAQQRGAAEQAQQNALAAAEERGGGPMGNLAASPVAVEAQRGIGRTSQIAEIWQNRQRALQEQTQQDITAGLRALGTQEVMANQTLQRSLEDTLNQLAGQEVGVRSELAQAVYGGKSAVAQANYNEILAAKAAEEARRLAAIKGQYDVEQARIDAEAKMNQMLFEQQNRVTNYPGTVSGVNNFMRSEGANDQDIANFWGSIDSSAISGLTNSQDAFAAWLEANTATAPKGGKIRPSAGQQAAARLYFDNLRYPKAPEESTLDQLSALGSGSIPNTGTTSRGPVFDPRTGQIISQ